MPGHSRARGDGAEPTDGTAKSGLAGLSTQKKAIAIAAIVVVLAGVVVGVVAATGGGKKNPSSTKGVTTTTVAALSATVCPLTDTPAPGGVVPDRPALLVKVGNEPEGARPQSGLNEADIIYDTPAEGFVMRYVAVYQCNNASSIGPTRSVRWVDYHMIARPFFTPILAYAQGINPNLDGVAKDKAWLSGIDLLDVPASVAWRISTREAPDNLYTSTKSLYAVYPKLKTPPPSVFTYSAKPVSAATPAASLAINFSEGTDVVWKWDAQKSLWMHTYSGVPDVDVLTKQQVSTTNIVVQIAKYTRGRYSESLGGGGDVQSQLLGSGPGYILRNGTAVKVTWHRTDEIQPTSFTDAAGQKVSLAPGRTWVEIVPNTQADALHGIVITK
jgi:Protein of unknown function (DUF3048) C-terminal domain/Protein of unknown function (DUF3048) N-terminal domain